MSEAMVLACVVNISEGRDPAVLGSLAQASGPHLLDVHRDPDHHRSVFTLGGQRAGLEESVRHLAAAAVRRLDIGPHCGVHPRIGVLDVVPWVSLAGWPLTDGDLRLAVEARNSFAQWAGQELRLPCFFYGPERSLPDVRRGAWTTLSPDTGPHDPHPTAGAAAVGARRALVAYNLWLDGADRATARGLAAELRSPTVRALGLPIGSEYQVSCNLIAPWVTGPAEVYDAVARRHSVARAELVGLIPRSVLQSVPPHRWAELDLDWSKTIEARLEEAGLDGGSSDKA